MAVKQKRITCARCGERETVTKGDCHAAYYQLDYRRGRVGTRSALPRRGARCIVSP